MQAGYSSPVGVTAVVNFGCRSVNENINCCIMVILLDVLHAILDGREVSCESVYAPK